MTSRIYKVDVSEVSDRVERDTLMPPVRRSYLIDATSANQAKAYVAGKFIKCGVAKAKEVADLYDEGVKIEYATEGK